MFPIMHALDALGSPVRRDILLSLRNSPLTVGELAGRFPVSRPAISRHLKVLSEGGLVELRTEGSRRLYAIRINGFASVRAFLDEFWDTALARLELLSRK
ncbi:MAG: winged helix-turn-helix domain-containing protein [Bryobacteraceae bacterium]|jgi:DNA-binding transcriptional ArsR family regulator